MGLMDFVPVAFFAVTAVILLRDLYNKMVKGAYALLAAGTINVFTAGFCKALWKLLYAANICDFSALEHMFLPFYLVVSFAGVVAAIIVPKLPPLSKVPETYYTNVSHREDIPAGMTSAQYGMQLALEKAGLSAAEVR